MSGPEGTNGTRLVRMSTELFEILLNTATSNVTVDWGEPTEWVWPLDDPQPSEEGVYTPTITRHFHDDLDDSEVGDGDSWM